MTPDLFRNSIPSYIYMHCELLSLGVGVDLVSARKRIVNK